MKIIAVDPGITTGLAYRESDGELRTSEIAIAEVMTKLDTFMPDVVLVERFATSGRISSFGLRTVELVGQVTEWSREHGSELIRYTPTSRRSWQHKAKELVGKGRPHEEDALAHLLHYMWEKGLAI